MVLYLGSQEILPCIPYNSAKPAFNTRVLEENEKPVLPHFTSTNVIYIGSNEGCGCAFRHALYHNEEWSYVTWEEGEEAVASQADHQALADFLKSSRLKSFEIYGCWDGDQVFPEKVRVSIDVEDILHSDFYFQERAYYSITIGS